MRGVFADASYWVALLNPHDQLHRRAQALAGKLENADLVTTEFVLAEFLNFYAPRGAMLRSAAAELATRMFEDPRLEIVPSSRKLFAAGLVLYRARRDKRYSLTDCISMVVMRGRALEQVLTQDRHFRQEGFATLLAGA